MADEETGSIALCSHDVFKSIQNPCDGHSLKDKFLVRFQPKVMLVPSISDVKSGMLVSHCFVRCPAPNILNASVFWLATLHADNIVRLWNIDDGRCIAHSNNDMLASKGIKIKAMGGYPGHVIIIGDLGDIYAVNVYTMQVVSHMCMSFKGFVKCKYDSFLALLTLCDENGSLTEFIDSKADLNMPYRYDDYT